MYQMAKHPNIQEKVYEELCQVITPGTDITYETFEKLKYLKAVIKETYRQAFSKNL